METIGQRIKKLRRQNGVTQKEFSQRVCVSQSYLSRVETDKEVPTEMLLKLIALEFSVSYEWLYNGRGDMPIPQQNLDYFDRNMPIITDYTQSRYQSLAKIIQNSQSSYLDATIGVILLHIESIIKTCKEDENRSRILIEVMANCCIEYSNFIEQSENLDFTTTKDLNRLYKSFSTAETEIINQMSDVLKSYASRFEPQ